MPQFKTLATSRLVIFVGGSLLTLALVWPLMGTAQDKADKAKDPDAVAQHKDKQTTGDQNLASQVAELHVKVEKLEAALKQNQKGTPSGTPDKGGQADKPDKAEGVLPGKRVSAKFQNCIQCHQTRPSGPLPPSHLEMAGVSDQGTKQDDKTGIGDNKKPAGGMGMMDEKKKAGMGMMDEKKKAGMGMMDEMKKAGMGMMDMADKKSMGAMGGGKAGTGGSTAEVMDQQMMQMLQMMQQMMDMKMKMMDKEMGTGTEKMAKAEPHSGHTDTPSGTPEKGGQAEMQDKTPDPAQHKPMEKSAAVGKDLPAQVAELQARIAKLEAAQK